MQRHGDAAREHRAAHVLHFQHRFTDGMRHAWKLVRQVATDHPFDDALAGKSAHISGPNILAVAQDREAVGNLLHLLEKMTDIHDSDAAIAKPPNQPEETPCVLLGE